MSEVYEMPPPGGGRSPQELSGLRTVTLVVYGLQALSFFWGLPAVVAIVINYIKRDDVRGTVYESHGGLKSEVQHPTSGKVHRCRPERPTANFSLRSA
jgi:hypothetical protein